jgi:hypothetical protein
LTWTAHISDKITKAKRLLFKFKQIVGKEFGPHPTYMRWMYTGIVRPALTYGAVVWWRAAASDARQLLLTRVNRLALLTFGGFRRSTPTVGMEVFGYLPPLDLFMEGIVTKSWLRIRGLRNEIWDGIGQGVTARGHRRALRDLAADFDLPSEADNIPTFKKWGRLYNVLPSPSIPPPGGTKCFTGGKKLPTGLVGAGFQAQQAGSSFMEGAFRMDPSSSAFQADLTAITKASEALLTAPSPGPIIIYTKSMGVVQALNNPQITSKTVLATATALDELAFSTKLPVVLQPQRDSPGLRAAHFLAQRGAALPSTTPGPVVPVSFKQLNSLIDSAVERRWQRRWDGTAPKAPRLSHDFWPVISRSRSSELLLYNRTEYSSAVRIMSGHNNMNWFRFKAKEVDTEECRLCLDGDEASDHLFQTCPALDSERLRVLGRLRAEVADLGRLPLHGVRSFTNVIRRALSLVGLEKI